MPPTTTLFRAARPIFQSSASRATFSRGSARGFRSNFSQGGRRFQSSSTAGDSAGQKQQQSWFKRMWDSPIGFKTVHFWAPVMKWALVLAGIGDFARPAEVLSATQNGALTATGLIWTRWCFVITPQNYLLAAVNFFLGCVGVAQLTRIALYHSSQKELPARAAAEAEEAKRAAGEVKEVVKS